MAQPAAWERLTLDPSKVTKSFGGIEDVDLKKRMFDAWVSVEALDRDKEVVPIDSYLQDLPIYMSNPVLLLGHVHKTTKDSLPIGRALQVEKRGNKLWAKFYVATTSVGNDVLTLIHEKCLRGLSCGFIPIQAINSPSDHELPLEFRGKGVKRYYKRVELVEISLLAIPSNRESLVAYAEKGNRFAGLVLKGMNEDTDITPVLKEWLQDEEDQKNIDLVMKEWLRGKEEEPAKRYTLKDLYQWNEDAHPRDEFGMFSTKPSSYLPDYRYDPKHEETQRKLDQMVEEQKKTRDALYKVKDTESWGQWGRKWLIRAAAVGLLYLGLKKTLKSPEAREKVIKWVEGQATKGAVPIDDVDKFLSCLDTIHEVLEKGKEVGATATPEYQKLQRFYAKTVEMLRKNVGRSTNIFEEGVIEKKGLSYLLLATKEMSAEDFKEEEHPRNAHGQFRRKSEGSGPAKATATHVDESHELPPKSRIEMAMDHPDEPGAGAAKRRELDLDPDETFRTVLAEHKRGTLRSGDGTTVTNPKQAQAIAFAEKKKAEERRAAKEVEESVQTKAMSAEDFKEEEHPRAPKGSERGGEFVSKNEPNPESGTWGGARKNAGRMVKDPVAAKQKLEERIKAENPKISNEELHQKMVDYATEKKNADLLIYLKDPVGYQKKREQEVLEASAAAKSGKVPKGKNPGLQDSGDTQKTYTDLKTTKAEWDREVRKHQDVYDAIKVFQDENADAEEKYHAKLVIAAATIATVVGLGVIAAKWPKLANAGLHYVPGADTGFRAGGTPNMLGVEGKYFHWGTIIDDALHLNEMQRLSRPDMKHLREVDLLGWITSKVLPKKAGQSQFVGFGPGFEGYLGKFKPKEYFWFKRTQADHPRLGDHDWRTGLPLIEGEQNKLVYNKINIAIGRQAIPDTPGDTHRFPKYKRNRWGKDDDGEPRKYPPGIGKGHENVWEYRDEHRANEDGSITVVSGEQLFDKYLTDIGIMKVNVAGKKEIPFSQFPLRLIRRWPTGTGSQQEDFKTAAGIYRGVFNFFDKQMVGPISLRTLSMLTAAASITGSGETIYYFQKDIEKYLTSYLKQKEEEEGERAKIGKKPRDYSAEMKLEKQKEKTAKAQGVRADKQRILELQRENVINALVKLGARRWEEGARTEKTLTEETIRRHLTVPLLNEHGYTNTEAGWSEFKNDLIERNEKGLKLLDAVMDKAILEDIKRQEAARQRKAEEPPTPEEDIAAAKHDRETLKKTKKGLSYLITKAFEDAPPEDTRTDLNYGDDLLTLFAEEIADQIANISQSCKLVIQSGMPGNSKFAELNDMVNEVYAFMKDRARGVTEDNIVGKSFEGPMASTSDAGGGLLVGKKVCKKCNEPITDKCKREDCPEETFLSATQEKE